MSLNPENVNPQSFMAGVPSSTGTAAAPNPGPGGGPGDFPQSFHLRPWAVISQMVTWAPTPEYAQDRGMECGQACMVMCLKHCTGVWTSAAYLDQLVHVPGTNRGTTLDQMVTTLALMETHAEAVYPSNPDAMRAQIESEITNKHPLIVLRYWDHPGNSLLHYACIIGYDHGSFEIAGPGHGVIFNEDDNTFWSMYAGALVLVHRKRMLGEH